MIHIFDRVLSKKDGDETVFIAQSRCFKEKHNADQICDMCNVMTEASAEVEMNNMELIELLNKNYSHPLNSNKMLFESISGKIFWLQDKNKELREEIKTLKKYNQELVDKIDELFKLCSK